MGKASRWIKKLLLGKKEDQIHNKHGDRDRDRDNNSMIMPLSPPSTVAIIPATPRRRWSFRRSNSAQKVALSYKSCRPFDSIMTSQLPLQDLFDRAMKHQNHAAVSPAIKTAHRVSSVVAVTAATKIQAAFRSFLARKALCALRGLVKLQALVRGHLVRKHTAAMVRCMSALVAIQLRARFQRIQMAHDAGSTSKQGFMMGHKRHLSAPQLDYNEKSGQFVSKTSRQASRRFSIDSSPLTREKSIGLNSKSPNEVATSSQNSIRHDEPNYMNKTESSRAKIRSQSEPRRRLTKQKPENRRTSSNEVRSSIIQDQQKDHEGLLTRLYGSSKSTNGFEFDSDSICTNGSSYYAMLYDQYEIAESLY